MRIEFSIDFGYRFLYSRQHYHPTYCWDGLIECTAGKIISVSRLTYSESIYGPVHSPVKTPLAGSEWKFSTRREIAGIYVVAEGNETAGFSLKTFQGDFLFTARRILEEGRVVFPVGSKYSHCTILVTRKGYLWYRPTPMTHETVIEPAALKGVDVVSWSRMEQARIDPATGAEFDATLPEFERSDENNWLFHLQGMTARQLDVVEAAALDFSRIPPLASSAVAADYIPMDLWCDDRLVGSLRYYFRHHDRHVQVLHDVWMTIPVDKITPGRHQFKLVNRHQALPLLVNRISFRPKTLRHLKLQTPVWALIGKETSIKIFVHNSTMVQLEYDARLLKVVDVKKMFTPGWHALRFIPLLPSQNVRIGVRDLTSGQTSEAFIAAVYALLSETPEVKVGFDMTTVPHDETGEMDWILDYTYRTQLGNLVVFRPFTPLPIDGWLWRRWGEFCRNHRIFVQAVDGYQDGNLIAGAGDYFMALGGHELSMATYYPYPDNQCKTMKESLDRYLEYFRQDMAVRRYAGPKISYGDAGGGHRYTLMAGVDFIRAETMGAHTMQHLSQARPAAQAIGNGQWGVHIAIQHCKQPYLESHLGQYYLSLLQPWMMGASFFYEEDSLFLLFKEERQCWDDALTKGKRDMTRDFFRFVSTHPRSGRPEISCGVILGRYAAPFNGFTCILEADPSYSVWGKFGRNDSAWGHRQPEKAVQVMDVLMPGASTHPLRQREDQRRFYFSGTPYGDFDQVPIEATGTFLARYRLLMHLGWNTMLTEDYKKLVQYVMDGGTLFLSVPHLSTHETREFLLTMDDLSLYAGGNVQDLCGVKILGRGDRYGGHWQATTSSFHAAICPPLSRAPSVSPDEDGPCHLAEVELHGAKPVIIDAISQKPLLVEHNLGRGRVYLMTTWAYPGHEELSDISGAIVTRLAQTHMCNFRVVDPTREIFWTYWPAGQDFGVLMLLNTDWTEKNCHKQVEVISPAVEFSTIVRERETQLITCLPFGAIVPDTCEPHIEFLAIEKDQARLRIHAVGPHHFALFTPLSNIGITVDGKTIPLTRTTNQGVSFKLTWEAATTKDLWIKAGE